MPLILLYFAPRSWLLPLSRLPRLVCPRPLPTCPFWVRPLITFFPFGTPPGLRFRLPIFPFLLFYTHSGLFSRTFPTVFFCASGRPSSPWRLAYGGRSRRFVRSSALLLSLRSFPLPPFFRLSFARASLPVLVGFLPPLRLPPTSESLVLSARSACRSSASHSHCSSVSSQIFLAIFSFLMWHLRCSRVSPW